MISFLYNLYLQSTSVLLHFIVVYYVLSMYIYFIYKLVTIVDNFKRIREKYNVTMYNRKNFFYLRVTMKKLLGCLLLIVLGSNAIAAGDIKQGKIKSYTCTGCHGIKYYMNAFPSYHVPRLGGQNELYLISALKSYRSGERSHSTMQAQAGSLSDKDIADIAAYFASLEK